MSLEAIPLDIIIPSLFTLVGSYLMYVTATNKNKNDKQLKEKELSGASWLPLVEQMQTFFETQKNHMMSELEDLRMDMQVNNAYKHDVSSQIRVFRSWVKDQGCDYKGPLIETFDEWFIRYSETKG